MAKQGGRWKYDGDENWNALCEEVETAIKNAPAERVVSGRHQNALGQIIAEKIEFVVTNKTRASAALAVVRKVLWHD